MAPFFAFLHHLAAFAIVAALVLELVLLRGPLTAWSAKRILAADSIYGAAAGLLLVVGLLRVFYFEKGAGYYFNSLPFLAKLALFILIGLASIYPTVQFLAWRKPLKEGQAPVLADGKLRLIRKLVHFELAAVVLLLLCAALMARGVGMLG